MRGRRLALAAGGVGALGAAGWAVRAGLGRFARPAADVPTTTAAPAPFVRTVVAEGAVKPVAATSLSAPSSGRSGFFIAALAEDGAQVKKGDVVIRFDATEAARVLADGENDRTAAEQRIAREQKQIDGALAERERTARLTKEEMAKAKELGKKDPRFFPRNEVIESEIDEGLYTTRLAQTEAARIVERRLARSRIELLAVERRHAEITTRQALEALRSLEVRAPHDGTFIVQRWQQRLVQTGDRAWPGMRVAEIARNDEMNAEVFVLEADAGGLAPGQRAEVVLEARPDAAWKARVKAVDPFPKPLRSDVPAQYFGALLELEGETRVLKPGQGLRATIVLDELPHALVVPRQAVFMKDDESFVYKRRADGSFAPAPVRLGPGTAGRIVIEAGVAPGDRLALRDPNLSAEETVGQGGARRDGRGGAGGPRSGAGALVEPGAASKGAR